jgi:hypothetical protein
MQIRRLGIGAGIRGECGVGLEASSVQPEKAKSFNTEDTELRARRSQRRESAEIELDLRR